MGLISLLSKGLSRVFSTIDSSKASILQHSAFFMVQLSHLYMTTGKIIVLTRQTFVSKVISLLFNMLSRFVIGAGVFFLFLPRSRCLFNFVAAVTICSDFGDEENSLSLFPFFPFCLPWSDGTGCHDLSFSNAEFQASFFTVLFHCHLQAL